jgi:hypothetical protein
MRNSYLLIVAIASLISWHATAAQLTVDPIQSAPGKSLEVPISLSDASSLSGLQFDLAYPASLMTSQDAIAGLDLPAGCIVDSEIISNDGETAVRRILIYSPENLTFGTGSLVNLPLTIEGDAPVTNAPITLAGVSAADSNASAQSIDGDESMIEIREISNYAINSTVIGANGSITPLGETTVEQGTDQTFTITPAEGYLIDQLLVDADSVDPVAQYTFASVSSDHEISVSFKLIPSANIALTYAPPSGGNNGFALLNLSGTSGSVFQIERSPKLVTWDVLGTVLINNGAATFDLTPFLVAPGPQFFRGRAQ